MIADSEKTLFWDLNSTAVDSESFKIRYIIIMDLQQCH